MTAEQQGVSPATAGGASIPGPWDIGHSPATGGRNLYVRDSDGDVYVGVIFEPADARRIVEAMNAAERPRLADPRDAEIKRLRLARRALVATGYFRDDEVSDDVAPRIAELNSARTAEIDRLRADALLFQQHLQRAHGRPEDEVTDEYMGVDFSRAMVDGLRDCKERAERDLARERAIYADSPDDRLYHAADNTWWRRNDEGRLEQAERPAASNDDFLQEDALFWRRKYELLDAGLKSVAADRIKVHNELPPEPPIGTKFVQPKGSVWTRRNDGWHCPGEPCNNCPAEWDEVETYVRDATRHLPGAPVTAEPRRWRVGDPEPEIGTTVWRRAERYRRSSNGWHRVGDFTGYGSWAWILSVGSEVVEAVDRG